MATPGTPCLWPATWRRPGSAGDTTDTRGPSGAARTTACRPPLAKEARYSSPCANWAIGVSSGTSCRHSANRSKAGMASAWIHLTAAPAMGWSTCGSATGASRASSGSSITTLARSRAILGSASQQTTSTRSRAASSCTGAMRPWPTRGGLTTRSTATSRLILDIALSPQIRTRMAARCMSRSATPPARISNGTWMRALASGSRRTSAIRATIASGSPIGVTTPPTTMGCTWRMLASAMAAMPTGCPRSLSLETGAASRQRMGFRGQLTIGGRTSFLDTHVSSLWASTTARSRRSLLRWPREPKSVIQTTSSTLATTSTGQALTIAAGSQWRRHKRILPSSG
mmetsp:Transcript_59297/g.150160  ORF Transcript_59297/g.150160 Transcript_59297/m.150160 type:complete len:342 (-) Transcript_59297:796-1821(-)